ncbi:MAG: hypothetical protein M5U34_17365 [Chloroflexi bacterium]|nr:hypothetical protein [Chloroflexota bacterium]
MDYYTLVTPEFVENRIYHALQEFQEIDMWLCLARYLLLLTVVAITACTSQNNAWPRIQETGVLRVGPIHLSAFLGLFDGENLTGIDVDATRSLADLSGLQVEFYLF